MAITAICACGYSLTTVDRNAGREATCPACGSLLVVPTAAAVAWKPKRRRALMAGLSGLGAKLRRHAPGLVVGLLAGGIIALGMTLSRPAQPPRRKAPTVAKAAPFDIRKIRGEFIGMKPAVQLAIIERGALVEGDDPLPAEFTHWLAKAVLRYQTTTPELLAFTCIDTSAGLTACGFPSKPSEVLEALVNCIPQDLPLRKDEYQVESVARLYTLCLIAAKGDHKEASEGLARMVRTLTVDTLDRRKTKDEER